MAEVINLRLARKNKKRKIRKRSLRPIAINMGKKKADKKLHEAQNALSEKTLDQQKLNKDE